MSSEYIFGRRPVWEVLQAGERSVHKIWMQKGPAGGILEQILNKVRQQGAPIEWVSRERLDHLVRGNHQGVVVQVAEKAFVELEDYLDQHKDDTVQVLVALDEIQDPQNVGAILRSAGFFGVAGILMPKWRSAPVSEAAVRVSAGAAEHLTLIRIGNLVQTIDQLKEVGFEVIGADMAGKPLASYKPGKRVVLVMGNEGSGLRRLVKEHCDELVGIPAKNKVGSLNVASTTGIFLYHITK